MKTNSYNLPEIEFLEREEEHAMGGVRQTKLELGSFWSLYRRLAQGTTPGLGLTTCCELGCQVERWLAPGRPNLIWQNGGGWAPESELPLYQIQELLIVHHYPCHFSSGPSPEQSLRKEWERLQASLSLEAERQPLLAHFWLLEGENVLIYRPEQDRLVHPFDLITDQQR